MEQRTYPLVPDTGEGDVLRCRECDRTIKPGYPFVPLVTEQRLHEGDPIASTFCVYCVEPESAA